jgi:hypothetical protein
MMNVEAFYSCMNDYIHDFVFGFKVDLEFMMKGTTISTSEDDLGMSRHLSRVKCLSTAFLTEYLKKSVSGNSIQRSQMKMEPSGKLKLELPIKPARADKPLKMKVGV